MAPKFFSTTEDEEASGLNRADLIWRFRNRSRRFFLDDAPPCCNAGPSGYCAGLFCAGIRQWPLRIYWSSDQRTRSMWTGCAVFWLIDWPALKAYLPASRLLIAGGVGKHLPSAVSHPDDIAVFGFVEDLADAYRMADIVVNPVRSGTGLNIKSIEALGYGKPLLTTTSGCRGIESVMGSAFLCADTPAAFVECVRRIWHEAGCASRLSAHALKFAREWNMAALASLGQVLLSHDRHPVAAQSAPDNGQAKQ